MSLKKKQKQMKHPGGMTYKEIGQALGVSAQYVQQVEKQALRKLKFRLREFLQDY